MISLSSEQLPPEEEDAAPDDVLADNEDDEPQVGCHEDEDGALPLRFFPPADGWCYFDELPAETLLHIFSFFTPGLVHFSQQLFYSWSVLYDLAARHDGEGHARVSHVARFTAR